MSDFPAITIAPDVEAPLGMALARGRMRVTIESKESGAHVSLSIRGKAKDDSGRWRLVDSLEEADRLYADVPTPDGPGRNVACVHLSGKLAGKMLPPWGEDFDSARLWALRRVIDAACGRAEIEDEQARILIGSNCLVCNRDLNDPESIKRGIGPECWQKVTGLAATYGRHAVRGEEAFSGQTDSGVGSGVGAREEDTTAEELPTQPSSADSSDASSPVPSPAPERAPESEVELFILHPDDDAREKLVSQPG